MSIKNSKDIVGNMNPRHTHGVHVEIFNDAFIMAVHTVSNDRIADRLRRILIRSSRALCKVLSRCMPVRTEEN